MKPWGSQPSVSDKRLSVAHVFSSCGNRERLAGGSKGDGNESPLVAGTDAANLGRMPVRSVEPIASVPTSGLHSTMRAAALVPALPKPPRRGEAWSGAGPVAPARLSQIRASPLRYGQPPETVACLLG